MRERKVDLKTIIGESGTRECRLCKAELEDGRKNWCSPKCKRLAYTVKYALNWQVVRDRVLERDNHKCQFCDSKDDLHVDHIIPVSKNGAKYDEQNLQVLCADCNLEKSDKSYTDWEDPHRDFKSDERKISLSEYEPNWI